MFSLLITRLKAVLKTQLKEVLKTAFDFMQKAEHRTLARLTAVFLIVTLLVPAFLFNPIRQAQAQAQSSLPVPPAAAPVSAPPQAFILSNSHSLSTSLGSAFGSFLSFSGKKLKSLFGKPELPAGLEQPENQPTLAESSITANSSSSLMTPSLPAGSVRFDFDGDGKADVARWHASSTEWKIKKSSNGAYQTETLGSGAAVPAPGDFDGDGKTDVALFNAGTWTIKKTSNNQTITVSFGSAGDQPVVGDYDGDGLADCAIFRPSTSTWWILQSSNSGATSTAFGSAGDLTAQGNFDGDSKTDIAVFRPSTGDWHVLGSTSGYFSVHWGVASDIPVPADFDGDGKTDFAVYRGSTGTWYASKSSTNNASYIAQSWGNFGDQPAPADYDGDGTDDIAVWRPTTGVWYIIKSGGGYDYPPLGQTGDTAISSAYLKQIGGLVYSYDFAKVRLSPKNATGGTDLYSRNFSWGTGLVSLPGRAGMDAGFGISYNSLIWTKDATNNTIVFDVDNSNVTPGFRMGFPTIEPVYYDASTGKFAYLMVTPSGGRVEFRQTAASGVYETADSAYTQLKIDNAGSPTASAESLTLTVTTTNGTQAYYEWKGSAYKCQKITDRNGNYIDISHDADGKLQSVTDTLGRVINVNYNGDGLPGSITQTWKDTNGEGANVTHTYATLSYTTKAITTNFSGSPTVIGPSSIKVLEKITFPTESNGAGPNTVFSYNTWGQVKQITTYAADNSRLNYVKVNLPADETTSASDCPRFTETRSLVENFNMVGSAAQETVVTNSITENASYSLPDSISGTATKIEVSMTGDPYGHVSKTFVGASGWQEGLPIATEDWANGTSSLERKRWTWTSWTQDDTNLTYIQNPRMVESKVGDTSNIKRSTTEYYLQTGTNIANYGRVKKAQMYAADGTTVWKELETTYNDNSAYLSRRMIALPSTVKVSGFDQSLNQSKLVSFVTYAYDEGDFTTDTTLEQNITSVTRHDSAYSSSFIVGRGNLTGTTQCDVSYTTSCTNGITSSVKYNITGAPVAQISPAPNSSTRKITMSYADNFNDASVNNYTYAYPTKIYDPAGYYSEIKYRFDTGANVWAKSPDLNSTLSGKISTRLFDSVGRLQKEAVLNNGAEYSYTRYVYPTNQIQSVSYSTVTDTNNNGVGDTAEEVLSESWFDGAGRLLKSRTALPDSTGGWVGNLVEYDILGQVKRVSVPTEISVSNPNDPNSWAPAGDDYRLDGNGNPTYLWTYQKYDWKGRIIRKINTDGVDSSTVNDSDQLISYEGCGCAGGQVTTIQSEVVPKNDSSNTNGRRTQKIYQDILGRAYKTETFGWNGNVYSSTLTTFDGADRPVLQQQFEGTVNINHSHVTASTTYDGYGRLKTQHVPKQDENKSTTYDYNQDGSVSKVTDARGVETNYTYNNPNGLLTNISYTVPSSQSSTIPSTPSVSFGYDNLGNRISKTDGAGSTSYTYDRFSRLMSETQQFTGLSNSYTISYTYDLNGNLKTLTDPTGGTANYHYDAVGRLLSASDTVSGVTTGIVDDIKYRAWGATKKIESASAHVIENSYNNRLQILTSSVTDTLGRKKAGATDPDHYTLQFEYYNDGSIKRANTASVSASSYDMYPPDRTITYDALGRLKSDGWGNIGHNFNYDVWGNNISTTGSFWGSNIFTGMNVPFVNNRDSANQYDADGRLLKDGLYHPIRNGVEVETQNERKYDAAGRMVDIRYGMDGDESQGGAIALHDSYLYDGDGKQIKSWRIYPNSSSQGPAALYSSVTESWVGQIYMAFQSNPETFSARTIHIGKELESSRVNCTETDCNTIIYTQEATGTRYSFLNRRLPTPQYPQFQGNSDLFVMETDVLGNNIPISDPNPDPLPQFPSDPLEPLNERFAFAGDPRGLGDRCTMDGVMAHCDDVVDAINNGTGVQCPDNDCSQRSVIYRGVQQFARFNAYADGYAGFVPNQAKYDGKGTISPIHNGPPKFYVKGSFDRDTNLAALNGATGDLIWDNGPNGIAEGNQVLRFIGEDAFWNIDPKTDKWWGWSDGNKGKERIKDSELDHYRELMRKSLANHRCIDFLKSIGIDPDDVLKSFDRTRVQGGISRAPTGGWGGLNGGNVNSAIGSRTTLPPGAINIGILIDTLIHESIHGINSKYNDNYMAELFQNLGKFDNTGFRYIPNNLGNNDIAWSSILSINCQPTESELKQWGAR